MRGRLVTGAHLVLTALAVAALLGGGLALGSSGRGDGACPSYGRTAVASDPQPGALRVFAIQFEQQPAGMVTAASYRNAIECVMRVEVLPHLANGRPNLVVFNEDI